MSWLPATDQPIFKYGNQTLEQFLEANMVYPTYAKQNCIEATIQVAFQINNLGELKNISIRRGLGIDLDEEALRLINLTSRKWITPHNYQENTELIIPVKFTLKNYNCEEQPKQSIEKAIMLYQTRQDLENVVINFYKNKAIGKANLEEEQKIVVLKADLGLDAELVAEKMAEAKTMLKQGDNVGACKVLNLIRNIGFTDADDLIAENCK